MSNELRAAGNSVCPYSRTHRALATHSSVASLTPATTVVFRGGITMTGATGSAGASESNQGEGKKKRKNFRCTYDTTKQTFFKCFKPAKGGFAGLSAWPS